MDIISSPLLSARLVRHPVSATRGSALVIVLAFVVLMTGISFAIFTRAMSERKISNSSGNQTKVSLLADGAIATIIADLDSEITDGQKSTLTTAGSDELYFPKTPQDIVPERVGTADALPNLIKRSASELPFFKGGGASTRASGESTLTPSQNGRFVSPARWNSHYLLPKATASSDTDATPLAEFTAPDWILVDKKGGNPTTGSPEIVGRYAYAIYDEGGLLDLNAAGYPSTMTDEQKAQRGSLAFADLTQLTESASGAGTGLLTDAQIDAIVGRRNFASASRDIKDGSETALGGTFPDFTFSPKNATNYFRFGLVNPSNFLTVPRKNALTGDPSASDRMFLTRQEMIAFLLDGVAKGDAAARANLQTALQYLTQFTRGFNQPSVIRPEGSPTVTVGNDAVGKDQDDVKGMNPTFLKVRRDVALSSEKSVNGFESAAGEPVVAKRFPLNRLAWVTFKGPIAPGGSLSGDPEIQLLIEKYKDAGLTEDFLKMGTAENIEKAFGLRWMQNPDTLDGSGRSVWVFRPDLGASSGATTPKIKYLSDVAREDREPNFFELLRGGVSVGALTRSRTTPPNRQGLPPVPVQWQASRDFSTQLATIQLGANIIDQFDPDGYPIQISMDDGTDPRLVTGVEDLPYIYRIRAGMLMLEQAAPAAITAPPYTPSVDNKEIFRYSTNDGTASEPYVKKPWAGGGDSDQSVRPNDTQAGGEGPLTKTGVAAYMVFPDLWNPHDSQGNLGLPGPTEFRITVDSVEPDSIVYDSDGNSKASGDYNLMNAHAWKNNRQGQWSDLKGLNTVPFVVGATTYPMAGWKKQLSEQNSALRFSVPANNRDLFREPTIIYQAGVPTGSNLTLDAVMSGLPDFASYVSNGGFATPGKIDPLLVPNYSADTRFVGFPLGVIPLRWLGNRPPNFDTKRTGGWIYSGLWGALTTSGSDPRPSSSLPAAYFTMNLRYQGADGKWVTYDQKYTRMSESNIPVPQGTFPSGPIFRNAGWAGFVDPRTAKFGPMLPAYNPEATASRIPPAQNGNTNVIWRDGANAGVISDRPDAGNGVTVTLGDLATYPFSQGMNLQGPVAKGLLSQNVSSKGQYYTDADGILRRAMGGNASGMTGLPMATNQMTYRSRILNRPFRSVGELGYVFSGMPWKNIDLFSPESGFAALLDVFCINETESAAGVVAGKVNLNTRQIPVIKAIVAGAYRHENFSASSLELLDSGVATKVAEALVKRTSSMDSSQGPLQNVSDLVGRQVSGSGSSAVYDGFSKDLFGEFGQGGVLETDAQISGFGESVVRALGSVGNTRVWNLMIDLIAQTGKYPSGNAKFVVDGEQRYWVHLAIDRYTGKIIDMNTEMVKE